METYQYAQELVTVYVLGNDHRRAFEVEVNEDESWVDVENVVFLEEEVNGDV